MNVLTVTFLAALVTAATTVLLDGALATRVDELRRRRPPNVGISLFYRALLQKIDIRLNEVFSLMPGSAKFPCDRKSARQTLANMHDKGAEADRSFVAGLRDYVEKSLKRYNDIACGVLSKYPDVITEKEQRRAFESSVNTLKFNDHSDGFLFLTYMNDSGTDVTGYLDNLMFYATLQTNGRSPGDLMRTIAGYGVQYRLTIFKDPLKTEKGRLFEIENKIHALSEAFVKPFDQWLQTYDIDRMRRNDLPNALKTYKDSMFFMKCYVWVCLS